jgi:pantetheine-phosphate adenylyltransferase
MTVAMYPGRFDPVTNGHMDIVVRASEIFESVVVAVADSRSTLFSTEERRELFESAIAEAELPNVRVISYTGLTVNQAREQGASVLVRGMRALTDFSNEFDQALMNKKMAPEIESVYLMTALEHLFISGTRIREVAALGYNIEDMVPSAVAAALRAKFNHH